MHYVTDNDVMTALTPLGAWQSRGNSNAKTNVINELLDLR